MSNMSYCRFQNTLEDLRDCRDNMDEPISSDEEIRARRSLIKVCVRIAVEYGHEIDLEVESKQVA